MSVTCPCDDCGRWLPPQDTEVCADCGDNLCADCATATGHRTVHEPPAPHEATTRPQGWTFLRCEQH